MYINSPLNIDSIDGGDFSTDSSQTNRMTKERNNWLKGGVFIVIFGTLVQLVSNFIP